MNRKAWNIPLYHTGSSNRPFTHTTSWQARIQDSFLEGPEVTPLPTPPPPTTTVGRLLVEPKVQPNFPQRSQKAAITEKIYVKFAKFPLFKVHLCEISPEWGRKRGKRTGERSETRKILVSAQNPYMELIYIIFGRTRPLSVISFFGGGGGGSATRGISYRGDQLLHKPHSLNSILANFGELFFDHDEQDVPFNYLSFLIVMNIILTRACDPRLGNIDEGTPGTPIAVGHILKTLDTHHLRQSKKAGFFYCPFYVFSALVAGSGYCFYS